MANFMTTTPDGGVATGEVFNPALISASVQVAAENARVFRPLITEYGFQGPGKTLDILKLGTLAAAAYTEGAARTFSVPTNSAITVTPSEVDVAMSFTDKEMKRSFMSLIPLYSQMIGEAVAQKMDADVAAEYASASATATTEGDSTASVANLLAAIGIVKVAAKNQGGIVHAVLHTSAWDDLILDDKVINASTRGSGPTITGELTLGGGVRVNFTTAINALTESSVNRYQNMIFTPRALALVMKSDINVEAWDDRNNKAFRIAAGADYDVATIQAGEIALYKVTV